MANILITRSIPTPGLKLIKQSHHNLTINQLDRSLTHKELLKAVRDRHGIITQLADKIDTDVLNAAGPNLKVISNYAVGYNNIDIDEATRRNITVCNTPDVLTEATADIAWCLILGVARRASEGDSLIRSGNWQGWTPMQLLGADLTNKTLAIIGAGRIGYAVAQRAAGWNMKIIYVARSQHIDFEHNLNATRKQLDDALRIADFVSIHVPQTPKTIHLINEQRLNLMKPTAYLINTSRGSIIDETALVTALQTNRIAGAGLDVYENEPSLTTGLIHCPNTLLLPHLGSATHETRAAMARLAAKNLLACLDNKRPPHTINNTL